METTIAFEEQVKQLQPALLRYCASLTKNNCNAEDLSQTTILKCIQHKDKFDGLYLKAWMFKIATNEFINSFRRSVRITEGMELLKPNLIGRFEQTDDNISVLEILKLVDELPEKLKIPIKMRIEGYKYEEIGEALNINLGTVKSRIFFAREKLEEAMIK
jgi:RNA polymerase sigma-70 factor (ECF subfamily)